MVTKQRRPIYKEVLWFLDEEETRPAYVLESAGVTYPDARYCIQRTNGVEFFTVEYFVSGTGTLTMLGDEYHPHAGDVWILPPHVPMEYHSDSKRPWQKCWFNIGGNLPEALLEIYHLQGKYLFHDCNSLHAEFEQALSVIRTHGENAAVDFATLFHHIIAGVAKQAKQEESGLNPLANVLKAYCEKHWRETIRLEQLAAIIHRSPIQTLRIFKQAFGCSPASWLTLRKLAYTKQYLLHTTYTLQTIAELVGFSDPFYFANWFKRLTGSSPGQFRK